MLVLADNKQLPTTQEYENLEKLGKRFIKHTDWLPFPSFPDCYHLDNHI